MVDTVGAAIPDIYARETARHPCPTALRRERALTLFLTAGPSAIEKYAANAPVDRPPLRAARHGCASCGPPLNAVAPLGAGNVRQLGSFFMTLVWL
jgi:hypothetical protein